MKKLFAFIYFIFHFSLFTLTAQDRHRMDSLLNEITKFEAHKKELGSNATPLFDSTKAAILNNIAKEYRIAKFDTAMYYVRQSLALSQKIGFKEGIGDAYYNVGITYVFQLKYKEAVSNYELALKTEEEVGDKKKMALICRSMGRVFTNTLNFPEGLKYFLLRLKLDIEVGDKEELAIAYNDVSVIYAIIKDYPNAIKNQLAYIDICTKLGHPDWFNYQHLANDYLLLGNYTEALKYSSIDLKVGEEYKDSDRIENTYIILGKIDLAKGNYESALENYSNSMRLTEIQGNKPFLVTANFFNVGEVYEKEGDFPAALKFYLKGLPQVQLFNPVGMQNAYKDLAGVSEKLHNYKDYHEYEFLYKQIDDTINSSENLKTINGLRIQYEFDREQDSIKSEQIKKDELTTKEIENQKCIRNYTLGGLGVVFFFLILVFFQRNRIVKEKKRSEELLLNILPEEVAEELKNTGAAKAKLFDEVTVIFTDFKSFTQISEKLKPEELVAEIDYCFKGFDAIIGKYDIEKIKTIGDSYMAAGGLPVANKTHANDVVNAALEIVKFIEAHKQLRLKEGKPIFEIRIGINTGPVVAGIVGVKKFAYDIWGDTVNLASRMESSGESGKVNISGSTYELVKNDFTCTYRGKIQAKNKGEVDMYFVN